MKTIIEAGHYYKVNGPSTLSVTGWKIGKDLATDCANAELALLVDDYHQEQSFASPGEEFLDPDKAAEIINTLHEEADYVFSEAALAKAAPLRMNELVEDGLVKLRKGVLSAAGVRLGSVQDSSLNTLTPTCVFLDYLLLKEKAEHGEHQVTVLPDAYARQQSQLATVLGKLAVPNLVSYTSVLFNFDNAGNVTLEEVSA